MRAGTRSSTSTPRPRSPRSSARPPAERPDAVRRRPRGRALRARRSGHSPRPGASAAGSRDDERDGRPVRVGVVGLGYWGPNLARNLAAIAGCELALAVRRLRRGAREARALLPRRARDAASSSDLLDDPELDAIVLATPVPTHAELAVRVARGGKALLRREAARHDAADAERAVAAASAAGRILMVGHLLEYHPAVDRLEGADRRRRARRRSTTCTATA